MLLAWRRPTNNCSVCAPNSQVNQSSRATSAAAALNHNNNSNNNQSEMNQSFALPNCNLLASTAMTSAQSKPNQKRGPQSNGELRSPPLAERERVFGRSGFLRLETGLRKGARFQSNDHDEQMNHSTSGGGKVLAIKRRLGRESCVERTGSRRGASTSTVVVVSAVASWLWRRNWAHAASGPRARALTGWEQNRSSQQTNRRRTCN